MTLVFPASPNWFNPSICDVYNNKIVYGARDTLVVVDISGEGKLTSMETLEGHHDKVTSVVFLRASFASSKSMVASSSVDGSVKLWSLASPSSLLHTLTHHGDGEVNRVIEGPANTLISGDRSGAVMQYNIDSNSTHVIRPSASNANGGVAHLSVNPFQVNVVAIAYINGSIHIVEIKSGSVVARLHGHDGEIHTLSFRPLDHYFNTIVAKGSAVAVSEEESPSGTFSRGRAAPPLMMTSSDDQIKLWNASTWEMELSLKIPPSGGGMGTVGSEYRGGKKMNSRQQERAWVATAWQPSENGIADEIVILSSAYMGDLLLWQWKWPAVKNVPVRAKLFAVIHDKPVFSIVPDRAGALLNASLSANSVLDVGRFLTVSMDRTVSLWDRSTGKVLSTLPSIGGFVQSVDVSPHFTNVIAAGCGDNCIRLWKTGLPDQYSHKVLWKGLHDKVTTMCWSPHLEGMLAYGSEDGRVGTINMHTGEHVCVVRPPHAGPVVKVVWRASVIESSEVDGEAKVNYFLYSVGRVVDKASDGGLLIETNVGADGAGDGAGSLKGASAILNGQLIAAAAAKENLANLQISNFDLKQQSSGHDSLLAVGYRNGWIAVFVIPPGSAHDLRLGSCTLVTVLKHHLKLVSSLKWEGDLSSDTVTPLVHRFASADSGGKVVLVSVSVSEGSSSRPPVCSPVGDHCAAVTSLAWRGRGVYGTHDNRTGGMDDGGQKEPVSLLASASFDGTVQIWDLSLIGTTGSGGGALPAGSSRVHNGKILSVVWSRASPHHVISGSEDYSMAMWDYRQCSELSPPPTSLDGDGLKAKKKKSMKRGGKAAATASQGISGGGPSVKGAKGGEGDTYPGEVKFGSSTLGYARRNGGSTKCTSLISAKSRDSYVLPIDSISASLLVDASSGEKLSMNAKVSPSSRLLEEAMFMVQMKLVSPNPGAALMKGGSLLWNRDEAISLLREGVKSYSGIGEHSAAASLAVWLGDLRLAFEMIVESGNLNPTWLALAPAVGMDVWAALVRLYALQLQDEGDFHGAALFHLSVHDVHSAITAYQVGGLHADAVALCRSRLPPHDARIKAALEVWGEKLYSNGDYAEACRVYTAAGLNNLASSCAAKLSAANPAASSAVSVLTGEMMT